MPPYVRKPQTLEAAIPWLYLKGISTGEMGPALTALLGSNATGFSAKTVARLKTQWATEYNTWRKGDLGRDDWVYIWADGIYSGLRGEDHKLCALVIIGVNARGQKEFLAIEDGVRDSTQSWKEVLRGLKQRGLKTPKLAIGDGAMGFWAALDEVFPDTRHQRCCPLGDVNIACQVTDAQVDECPQQVSQVVAAKRQSHATRHLESRDTQISRKSL